MPEKLIFEAEIRQTDEAGAGAYVLVPLEVAQALGGKRVPVRCTFDGESYRGSVVNMGLGPCIGVLKAIREKIGKQRGDTVRVEVWRDEEERVAAMPPELSVALEENHAAKTFYNTLSYSRHREYCLWGGAAKRQETRLSRAQKAAALLEEGKRLKF